jgi:hypothetical protein
MDFREDHFDFTPHTGSGPVNMARAFPFPYRISQASVVLTGYTAEFTDGDHEFGRLIVQLSVEIENDAPGGPQVTVSANFGLRDWSGDWDDEYGGVIRFCLMVEREMLIPPAFGAVAL